MAKEGDQIVGIDTHNEMVPSPAGEVPVPRTHSFSGKIDYDVSHSVLIDGQRAAVVGSAAANKPAHIPTLGRFQKNPDNFATITRGSSSVMADGHPVARNGDPATSCDDMGAENNAVVVATGKAIAG